MATPNYSYEKRQKELAKKRKKEEKLKRKTDKPELPTPAGTYVDPSQAPQDRTPAGS